MERIAALHSRLQVTILLVMVVLGLWGMLNYLRNRPVTNNYVAVLVIGELLIVSQGLLGVLLLFGGAQTLRFALHIVYGVVAMLCLPITYLYVRGRRGRWESLIYACVCFFVAVITIRAWETGQ